MMTTYQVIAAGSDKPPATHDVELPDEPTLKQLQKIVEPHLDGMRLERVRVLYQDAYVDMFVGDGSAMKGLPVNHIATEHYHRNSKERGGATVDELRRAPKIHGPAVLFWRRVWF